MDWRRDCRHFVGDRPCAPHKRTGVVCATCTEYLPGGRSIAIVKLAAVGDVLRTTSILRGVRATYGPCTITWITAPGAVPLFGANREVDRVVAFDGGLPLVLAVEEFDLVLNLDAAPDSCQLAAAMRARERKGFTLGPDRKPIPLSPEAARWFEMGLSDAEKKRNGRTYQDIMFEIAGIRPDLAPADREMILELKDDERAFAAALRDKLGVAPGRPIVGLNTGAGGRWPLKKWTLEGYRGLIDRLAKQQNALVLLLGGPEEAERNRELAAGREDRVVDTGTKNSLRQFASLVDLCDVVVTGDTLAMHVAIARRKHVVVLFGPTSAAEIDVYGRGEKLASTAMDCLCCYLTACEKDPNCMNTIGVDTVHAAAVRMLEAARRAERAGAR